MDSTANHAWTLDIQGALTIGIIVDYIQVWDLLFDFQLQPEVKDSHIWRLAANGQYLAKSSYDSLFLGATQFKPYDRIYKSWAPPKCQLFLWLAANKWCWTSNHLVKRGLPHPDKCPMCDQDEETTYHLLVACMFARKFWYHMLRQVGLHSFAPQPTDSIFDIWWERVAATTSKLIKKGLKSLIILRAWTIWNHRNQCVFDGANPHMAEALIEVSQERQLWTMAGVRGLSYLTPPPRRLVCVCHVIFVISPIFTSANVIRKRVCDGCNGALYP
jgi:hypothetical protein